MSLPAYILLLIIFTITDIITAPFWMVFTIFTMLAMAGAEVPDIVIIIFVIIVPIVMSSIPISIVIAVNRKKYRYNEINRKELIIFDLSFSLIKIALSWIILIMLIRTS